MRIFPLVSKSEKKQSKRTKTLPSLLNFYTCQTKIRLVLNQFVGDSPPTDLYPWQLTYEKVKRKKKVELLGKLKEKEIQSFFSI
jgi:hypothetical protein